jgi:hypothetical protein
MWERGFRDPLPQLNVGEGISESFPLKQFEKGDQMKDS